jgi:hypothetical protein
MLGSRPRSPCPGARQFEIGSQHAGIGAAPDLFQFAKGRAPENRAITILWERCLAPEVDAINVSMAKNMGR